MANQPSDSPRYWIFKDTAENNPLQTEVDYNEPRPWYVESTANVKPLDVVYFWRREDSSYFYGWGVIDPTLPKIVRASAEPRLVVQLRYRVIFPTPVTSGDLIEDPLLKDFAGLGQTQENIIELNKTQVIALNNLIRNRDSEAPPDPVMDEDGDEAEELSNVTNLGQLREIYSHRLSMLSQRILDLADEFAHTREKYRGEITSSCILFAAVELGSHINEEQEVDNASEFLFYWMHENESRRSQYQRAFSDFRGRTNEEPSRQVATLTANALKIIETAASIAKLVRKGPRTQELKVIYARDLVGALLFTMATNRRLGATIRLAAAGLSIETLCRHYFDKFIDHEKNPDDDIAQWRKVIIDLTLPVDERPLKTPLELKPSLPNIDADIPSVKVDLLNITPEVEGFAKIIASADVKTPLSIGLFGDWGSGKSTFMEQLQATVEKIAKSVREKNKDQETAFLGNIVQIKFNAWHYAEANLWASLVSHVFENLSFSEAEEKQKAENRKQLFLGKLANTLAIQKEAEAEVKVKEANYEIAKTALDDVQRNQELARLELRHVMTQGVWPLVTKFLGQDPEAQNQINKARSALGKAGLTEEDLKREIEASRTTAGRLQLRLNSIANDPHLALKLAGILALMALIPLVLTYAVTQVANSGILERVITNVTPTITLIAGALAWWRTKRKSVNSILDTLDAADRQLDKMYASAKAEFDIERNRLSKEVAERQAEIVTAKKDVEDAKKERAETIAALREMEPARVLETFVQERAASTDYRKLLGVIALIRRDFKRLSDMLREQGNVELRQAVTEILKKDEEQRKLEAQTAPADGTVVVTVAAEPSPELVDEKLKEYRIDRIVLYIDDLDRCPPKQVVDVLQAIHLLLAFELFVVVVGVDARWIRHALRERYPKMLSEDWDNGGVPKGHKERAPKFATPRDYIEKIFQVPFWLRPMDDDDAQRLLEGLIPVSQISSGVRTEDNIPADQSRADAPAATVATPSGATSGVAVQDSAGSTTSAETIDGPDRKTQTDETTAAAASIAGAIVEQFEFVLKPESLLLDINERNAMVGLSRVIGKTPRTLKRFVNVYRIIKAGLNGKEFEAFVGTGPADAQYKAVLILLAVAYGAPDIAPAFFRAIKGGAKEMGLKDFLIVQNWSSLVEELNGFVREYDVDVPLSVLCEWLPVVVRYTFQLGSLSEEVANREARIVQA